MQRYVLIHILMYMKQVIVEFDDETASRLDRTAPARSRRRSEFIRAAVRRALDAIEEGRMAKAYQADPEEAIAYFDPGTWEPAAPKKRNRRSH